MIEIKGVIHGKTIELDEDRQFTALKESLI